MITAKYFDVNKNKQQVFGDFFRSLHQSRETHFRLETLQNFGEDLGSVHLSSDTVDSGTRVRVFGTGKIVKLQEIDFMLHMQQNAAYTCVA